MNRKPLVAGLLTCLLVIGCATAAPRSVTDPQAPRALSGDGPVKVSWTDPAQFTEIRQSSNRFEAERGDWVQQLAHYAQKTASKQLQPGQTLEVTITDIKRAGDYEPWHGPRGTDIRIGAAQLMFRRRDIGTAQQDVRTHARRQIIQRRVGWRQGVGQIRSRDGRTGQQVQRILILRHQRRSLGDVRPCAV
ncbi:MAG: DUF3016 domain-containing protein, partial [Stenotrophomonas sp.]